MASTTDPARELADICTKLSAHSNDHGDIFLSKMFGVDPWSKDFFEIMFNITKRADDLISLIPVLKMDLDHEQDAINHINSIKSAFSKSGLNNNWTHAATNYINAENIAALKFLSGSVRPVRAYKKLNDEEVGEVSALVDQLLSWLSERQLAEQDFIRQAIIDGLNKFRFRLSHIGWLGWGYSIESLKEVIGAYLALENGNVDPNKNPDAAVLLKKVSAFVKEIFLKTGTIQDTVGKISFVLLAYEEVTKLLQGNVTIAGLLPHSAG